MCAWFGVVFWNLIDIFQQKALVSDFFFQTRGYQLILKPSGPDNIKFITGQRMWAFLLFRHIYVHCVKGGITGHWEEQLCQDQINKDRGLLCKLTIENR